MKMGYCTYLDFYFESRGFGCGLLAFLLVYSAATGLVYGRLYSTTGVGNRLEKNMLKTDIIHQLDRCLPVQETSL